MPDDSKQPPSGGARRPQPAPPPPDPADMGTAYGMEISMEGTLPRDESAAPQDDDPLLWIRRWLERHKAR
jgi:hypothetical protein